MQKKLESLRLTLTSSTRIWKFIIIWRFGRKIHKIARAGSSKTGSVRPRLSRWQLLKEKPRFL